MNIIGISGPARSGKDTLADHFVSILNASNIKAQKLSFANELKMELDDFLLSKIGISAFTQNDEEKKIIRPMLVTWGTHVRRKLDPDVWIKSVLKQTNDNIVTVVSDVRFENELDWIHGSNGYSVFVDRVGLDGNLVPPANQDEQENTIPLREKCKHSFTWNTIENEEWQVAIAYEVLSKAIPNDQLEKWTKTCC